MNLALEFSFQVYVEEVGKNYYKQYVIFYQTSITKA